MSGTHGPAKMVGNDIVIQKKTRSVQPAPIYAPAIEPAKPVVIETVEESYEIPVNLASAAVHNIGFIAWQLPKVQLPSGDDLKDALRQPTMLLRRGFGLAHRYSLASFALLFLLVGSSAIAVAEQYMSAQISAESTARTANIKLPAQQLAGFNMTVPADQFEAKLKTITAQPLTIMVGTQPSVVQADTIRSWLQITESKDGSESYIHVSSTKINATLAHIADSFTKEPVNQVSVTHTDGTSGVIAAGSNGTKVADPSGLVKDISKNLLAAKGMQLNLATETVPFQAVTPAAFTKMIEINITTKQMYLWQNGQIFKQYPISAGAPETPTPLGQYKIFSQVAVQDMRGYNANGTKYLQPKVKWISYFKSGGYAIHGNYWRPTSWFGRINSSHGCASLPDWQAKEVYDWSNVGTTVITRN